MENNLNMFHMNENGQNNFFLHIASKSISFHVYTSKSVLLGGGGEKKKNTNGSSITQCVSTLHGHNSGKSNQGHIFFSKQ